MSRQNISPATLRDWPHGPIHRASQAGTYMVTAGAYQKLPLFQSRASLTFLTNLLLGLAEAHGWSLQAWAIFPNHYHFIAESKRPETLKNFIRELHSRSAAEINRKEDMPARKVWFQYWDSQINFH